MPIRILLLVVFISIGIYIYFDSKKKGLPGRFSFLLFVFSLIFPINLIIVTLYLLFGRRLLASFSGIASGGSGRSQFVICSKCGKDNAQTQLKCSDCGNVLHVKE